MSEEDDAACRAEIPPMLSQEQQDALVYMPQCRQRWGERQIVDATPPLTAEDIEEFLVEFAWLKETEVALQCLFDGGFDLLKAVQLLHAARRKRHATQRDRNEQLEPEAFTTAIETHGKKFHLVKQALGQRVTTREAVSKYYMLKRTTEFRNWRRLQTIKKRRKKKNEIKRLRLGDESDVDPEAEAFRDYHNKQCEICATGGTLLCCDGCARAYHFSCVQPPITKLPKRDDEWFCPYCQEVFGGAKPKMVPSEESEYCQVCLPFASVPRMLNELMKDSSSQEEDDELEGYSEYNSDDDAGLDSNDEVSDHDAKSSNLSSIENMISNTGCPGSPTDNESSAIALSFFPKTDSNESGKQQMATSVVKSSVQEQQSGAVVQSNSGSSQVSPNIPLERSVEANPAEMRSALVHSEKAVSGRKRHRKTIAPRRIPPSRFDN